MLVWPMNPLYWYQSCSLNYGLCVCVACWAQLKVGLGFDCVSVVLNPLTELADLRADGEKWVHPQDKHIQTLSLTCTNSHTYIFSKPLSLFQTHRRTHTVWVNNGPVSGVPMGKAVTLIESSILHSPCLLIDSVRLFCSTKRLTFSPVRLWLSQCEWLYVRVCVCVCSCILFT